MEQSYTLWLSTEERIVSFHQVRGYRMQRFITHEFFLDYLQNLQFQGYRFQ